MRVTVLRAGVLGMLSRAAALPCGFPGAGESVERLREMSCRVCEIGDASGGDGPLPPGWQMMTSKASGKSSAPRLRPPSVSAGCHRVRLTNIKKPSKGARVSVAVASSGRSGACELTACCQG